SSEEYLCTSISNDYRSSDTVVHKGSSGTPLVERQVNLVTGIDRIMGARVGGFVVLTGVNPESGNDFVLLLQRGVKYEDSKMNLIGCFGGHLNIEQDEQP